MASMHKTIQPLEYYRGFVEKNSRPDNRSLWEVRNMEVNINSVSHADASALVRLGNTSILCGIKAELAEPTNDNPGGFLVPNIDLPPLCSSRYRKGPPSDQAQIYSQFLNDVLKNSQCIEPDDLIILKNKLVWCLYIDLTCLDYDGNILDASIVAMISALKNLSLPIVDIKDEKITVDLKRKKSINLRSSPISSTFGVFDENTFIADPTDEEESLINGTVTIVCDESNTICGIHKPGGAKISDKQLLECLKRVKIRTKSVLKMIKAASEAL